MPIEEITVDELATRLEAGARLVDVREPHEFEEAHVPGAVLVPLGTVPDRIDEFGQDQPPLVICRTGARSFQACEFLADLGIAAVNVSGGTMAWVLGGREVASGPT